ncbi:hypothetical protein [Novosphingobium sp. UBA1939]|uniref:hypothetical protein n=1 Tax=Novosphingobium sp. UBA1939 TaxID=1946982 RepID=UPI0025CE2507|nr:hypothetical protein [Novosphingobium sp. UBA1939]
MATQLDLFATPPTADELGARILSAGLAPNAFLLDLNRSLSSDNQALPWPWNLPSRLMRGPIAVQQPETDWQGNHHPRRIGLRHPRLADHPFVKQAEAALGMTIDREPPRNRHGYSDSDTARYWHAVDLISAGRVDDLLRTLDFTDPGAVLSAVAYGLDFGPHEGKAKGRPHLTPKAARTVLAAIGADCPAEADDALRAADFAEVKQERGKPHRVVNWRNTFTKAANVWGRILGIERGWLKQGPFIAWTDAGKARTGALI